MTLRAPNEPTDAFTPLGPAVKPAEPKPSPPPPRAPQPGTVPVDMADIGMIMRDGSKIYSDGKGYPGLNLRQPVEIFTADEQTVTGRVGDFFWNPNHFPEDRITAYRLITEDELSQLQKADEAAHGFAPGFVPPAGMNDVMDYGSECVRRAMAERGAQQAADWLKLREWDEAMKDAGWRDMAPKPDKD